MSELMKDYIGSDNDRRELVERIIIELKRCGMEDEMINKVIDNFINNHGDIENFLRKENEKEQMRVR